MWLAALLLVAFGCIARAATVTTSGTAPVVNDADLANYGAISSTDKWWCGTGAESDARGQSFSTGPGALRLKAVTYQSATSTIPTKNFIIRVVKLNGTIITPVYSESATQSANWNAGDYVTWTFTDPPILEGNTVYGVDVGMTSSTVGWNTGIPYLNLTVNEFPGGQRYVSASGVPGVGGTTANYSTGDRIFHLDMETPLVAPPGAFRLMAGNPPDDATSALILPELVGTFSRNLAVGTGNITIRNLTDGTNTILAVNHPSVSISGNLLKIQTAGLIQYNKSYAVQIDAAALLDSGNEAFPGIADDTTWNFTTAVNDSFLTAVNSLKNHYNGSAPLNSTQIAAVFDTIVANKTRFSESAATISAIFSLVAAYDAAKGASFLLNTGISFGNPTSQAKTADWTVYQVMQTIMDEIYTPTALAAYESVLTGFKLGVSANFPGACAPPSNPLDSRTVAINASFEDTFGRATQMWTDPARKPTGTYLAPGTIATVTVPPALVNAGYKVRVGCHSWDLEARTSVKRLARATTLFPITSTTIKVANPYGGGIYIEVPFRANAGVQNVTVTGGVRSAFFSAKSFHNTTASGWLVERSYIAPWVDFQSEKFMFQVPRKWLYNMTGEQAVQLMIDWDKAMDTINLLMGFNTHRGKETMYCQPDVILRSAVHAPGYPAVNVTTNPNSEVSPIGYAGNYLVRGPATTLTAANIEFHEQGHAFGFPKFGGETESTVNLLQPAMLNRAFGFTLDQAQNGSFGSGNSFITIDTTAIAWMCVFNFSPRKVPMASGEKSYQHKGHAKFMDIARLFGWEKLDAYWRSCLLDEANNIAVSTGTDDLLLRLCRAVGKDIRPLFHFWGIHPANPSALGAAIAAENLPASVEIRDLLLRYKTLVPANNAAFRTFALGWWGRQPSINGYWEEREHARQWDTTPLYSPGDQQRSEATNPGEIYNENSANDIRNRIDELLNLYFPTGINPATMTFAIPPTAVNSTTLGMTATTATAVLGPIEYYFQETSGNPGGNDSGWQTSPVYRDTGLTPGLTYTYTVTARDVGGATQNSTSNPASATVSAAGDITPPSPSPMTFAIPPATMDEQSITMTATTATDVNGVEYYFENITAGTNSGWRSSPAYTESNLQPVTAYTYRVRARDLSANQNVTASSAPATASTANIPDVIPPQIASLSPPNGALVSSLGANLVVTFDEPVIQGSGTVTLKNLTDSTQTIFNIGTAAVTVNGNTLTLNPPSDLIHAKTYAVRISSGAVVDLSNNPFIGINDDDTWRFTAILVDPIANPGGPYRRPISGPISLDGSGSFPSHLATITEYAWDLNNDGVFGDVMGANPAAITEAEFVTTWGMEPGYNPIALRVTDSAGRTATGSTTVRIGVVLEWDSNGATANHTDGGGAWLNATQWRDEGVNTNWSDGAVATFGNGGSGGAVSLAASATVASFVFNSFTGTYTLGTAGNAITLNGDITKNSASAAVTVVSPLVLGAPQTWTNQSNGILTAGSTVNNGGFSLTVDGVGGTNIGQAPMSGSGGLIKNGPSLLVIGGGGANPTHTYSGATVINGGGILTGSNLLGTGNSSLTITSGVLELYYGNSFSRGLGSGGGQVRIPGGVSGFSGQGSSGSTFAISSPNPLVWGSTDFAPSEFILQSSFTNLNGKGIFSSNINLNGATRTIRSNQSFSDFVGGTGTFSGNLTNSTGSAGIVKVGPGMHIFSGTNSYNGGTTINGGGLRFTRIAAMPNTGAVTVNDGAMLGVALGGSGEWTTGTSGVGTLGGLLAGSGGSGTSTVTFNGNVGLELAVGSGTATYSGIISNVASSLKLYKTGAATLVLTGNNSYTGGTDLRAGAVSVGSNTALGTGPIFFNSGTIQTNDATTRTLANPIAALNNQITTGGTGNLVFTDTGDVPLNAARTFTINNGVTTFHQGFSTAFGLTKAGSGSLVLNGASTYSGATTVSTGKLFINGSLSSANVALTVSSGATLGGTGTVGRNVTVSAGGKLEFNLSTAPANHIPLNISSGRSFGFSGVSELTITSSGGGEPGIYTLVTGGTNITGAAPAVVNLPPGWVATVSIAGNSLLLNVTSTGALHHFAISNISSPQTVGTPITGITITAQDGLNNTVTGFTGTVTFGGTGGFTGTSANFTAGVLTGVSVTPMNPGLNRTFTVSDGDGPTGTATIASIRTRFRAWADGFPGLTDATSSFDLDGGGLSTGIEWVLGGDPVDGGDDPDLLPTLDVVSDPNFYIFTYRRSDTANNDPTTTVAVLYGSDLGTWTTAVHDGVNVIITVTDNFFGTDPGIDRVVVKLKRTLAVAGRFFVRLGVTLSE